MNPPQSKEAINFIKEGLVIFLVILFIIFAFFLVAFVVGKI